MTWYELDRYRFALELQVLKRHHAGARMVIQSGIAQIFYKHQGWRAEYIVRVNYPPDFPYSPPAAYVVKPTLLPTPHEYEGRRLCLHGLNQTNPDTSGKNILDWAKKWLEAYEGWLDNGQSHWPSKGAR